MMTRGVLSSVQQIQQGIGILYFKYTWKTAFVFEFSNTVLNVFVICI